MKAAEKVAKVNKGADRTAPVRRKGPQKAAGNPTKSGKIAGNWQDRK